MQCPECKADSIVIDSRPYLDFCKRRRKCEAGHRWSTLEVTFELATKLPTFKTCRLCSQERLKQGIKFRSLCKEHYNESRKEKDRLRYKAKKLNLKLKV